MKSAELKRVIAFVSTEDYKKGLTVLREDLDWEYSGFLHALNFYKVYEFEIALRRLTNAGMVKNTNFVVHA